MVRAGPRLSFFGGKGGVGKTTCAAAAAVRAAHEGARVLVVSTDPAHSLGDALDAPLGREPRRIAAARGHLWAAELDADRALSRWIGQRKEAIHTIAARGTYLDDEDLDRFLSLSLPGVDELVGLVELMRLARRQPFDEVVVDTAPTGHTLRLLEMPGTLRRLAEVLDDMHAKHRFLASSLAGSWPGDFADDAIAEIEEEAEGLRALLCDPARASFTWVTLPEELPVRESEDGVRGIEALGVVVPTIVVNRVWPAPDRPCALCTPRVLAERGWRDRLLALFAGRRVLEVPALAEEPRGADALLAAALSVRRAARGARAPGAAPPGAATPAAAGRAAELVKPSVRLVLVGGKGGVGKTTVAAALALELARARRAARVLVLSTDPAHSLGDVLDRAVDDEARTVAGGPPNLFARELDAPRAWEAERQRYRAAIDDVFASIFSGRMDASFDRAVLEDLLDLAPPGIDELLALVTILDALVTRLPGAEAGAYDVVVVDTAPTGHTLRLLTLPEKALAWVHSLMQVMLKYRAVIGLGDAAKDLTRLAGRLRALIALLADARETAFVVVARGGALPRLETERLAKDLRRLAIPVAAVVANAVTEPSCAWCAAISAAERPHLERLADVARRSAGGLLVETPATYPAPRGVSDLGRWRRRWAIRRERGVRRRAPGG